METKHDCPVCNATGKLTPVEFDHVGRMLDLVYAAMEIMAAVEELRAGREKMKVTREDMEFLSTVRIKV